MSSPSNATGQRVGKYDVLATISTSPRTRTYRGFDPDTKRAVAIKVIGRQHLDAAALPGYRKYAESLAKFEHPNVARFIEVFESERAVALVWELCEGVPLSSLLKDGAAPEMKNVWDIARRMLEALSFAHSRGLVHRDVKPSNVVLAPDGSLKVTDFGVSALLAGDAETIHYRAPEQFRGETITARTDIYNAGAIVYQLVTGKLPFTGTPAEVEHRVFEERPSDPSSYNNRIAWQLDWVIQKAMSKDPIERFNAAHDFAEGLRLGLQDTIGRPLEPLAPPPSAQGAPVPKPAPTPVREPTKPPVAAGPARPTAAGAPVSAGAQSTAGAPVTAGAQAPTKTQAAGPELATPSPAAPPTTPSAAKTNLAAKAQVLAKPAAAAPAAPVKQAAPKARLLFVDDEERILNAVKALFRQDYDVTTAVGGEAALALLKENAYHVIVSDQRMPGVTGVELLRQARTLAPNAVRMLLTGYTDLAALVGSINQGEIYKFVMKPWDNEDIKKSIAEAARIAFELAATATEPAPKPEHPRSAGSLLVIDPKEGLAVGLERLLAGSAKVMQVKTPQEAAKVLQGQEIAAIVADLGAGTDGLVALFKQLKEKRPEILSILLAEEPDSELGIELINRAQIYRFLPKPVSAKELRTQVAAAMRRYATLKQIPGMQRAAGDAPAPASVAAERARPTP
jgi:response regulator RpfG family c-di-GMP phosphodiesterase